MAKKFSCIIACALAFICVFASCGHKHNWSDWVPDRAATVLTDGVEYRTCGCGDEESRVIPKIGAEKALAGKWIWQSYPSNPMYMFLTFNGHTVRYGTYMFGEELSSASFDCTYKVDGTSLILTTESGTDFTFSIKDMGSTLKIFDNLGNEFVYAN